MPKFISFLFKSSLRTKDVYKTLLRICFNPTLDATEDGYFWGYVYKRA